MPARAPAKQGRILMLLGVGCFVLPFVAASLWQPEHQASGPTAGMAEAVYGVVLFTAMTIGVVLFVVGARRTSRAARRRSDIEVDHDSAPTPGRWVDGRWVCFEHRRRWCPECSAVAIRERNESEHPSTTADPDEHGHTGTR